MNYNARQHNDAVEDLVAVIQGSTVSWAFDCHMFPVHGAHAMGEVPNVVESISY
jgi:hypothetical protein